MGNDFENERTEFEAWYADAIWGNEDFKQALERAWQAGRAALRSQDQEDGERLDWLLRHLPGDAIRHCVGVIADTADIDEFRAAIDHARRVEEKT